MCVYVCEGHQFAFIDSQLTALFAAGKGNCIKDKGKILYHNTDNEPGQSSE